MAYNAATGMCFLNSLVQSTNPAAGLVAAAGYVWCVVRNMNVFRIYDHNL
jgi:hypothetical protein